ncbi:ABC transporter permease subunit [Paenibacillus sp. CC-CFT747]|nr:ABC transporter permease subunit [Paenibacillus sp. CC-CFT747]
MEVTNISEVISTMKRRPVELSRHKRLIRKNRLYYLMFVIPFLYYLVFHYIPMFGILIAFKDYNVFQGVFGSSWVGLTYFKSFLTDPYFYKLVRNTLVLGAYHIIFSFPAPIILALLLNELKHRMFKRFVQTISYLPHFLSTVVVVGMIVNFMAQDGVINHFLEWLGMEPVQFLMLSQWFRSIYISSEIWQGIGWGSIIYLAALTSVDPHLYEAATIDGANRWKQMRHITLPGIAPTIIVLLLFNIGAVMSVSFEKVLLLQNGSNFETSDVIATYVYRRGWFRAISATLPRWGCSIPSWRSSFSRSATRSAEKSAKPAYGEGVTACREAGIRFAPI